MTTETKSPIPIFIADDVALDFLNTSFGVGQQHTECLASDARILEWLSLANLPLLTADLKWPPGSLQQAALALRDTALALVQQRQLNLPGDPTSLNQILKLGQLHQELVWEQDQQPRCVWHSQTDRVEGLLLPVAQAIATLLAEGDFRLVRQCESTECTLWFYDRTKSHRRRWCSMAQCGNRMKVAAFRARQKMK
ncbi:CGNR zinc finger domain-containing protein [Neisseriaceae bacterium TC5R-5]|nr:CGNR zinc finger domain-containing protein [Neisseriaceae bacterium TC5R-5]